MSNYPTTYKQYNEPGLNGLFGWLRRKLNQVASIIAPVFPRIAHILDDFTNGDGTFFTVEFGTIGERSVVGDVVDGSLPLTPLDEANLDNWYNNSFEPYFSNIVSVFNNYKVNTPSAEEFVIFYNEVSMLIAFLSAQSLHDSQNGVAGLTENAVIVRNQFLDIQKKTLNEFLTEFSSEKNLDVFTRKIGVDIQTSKYASLGFTSPSVMLILYKEIAVLNGTNIDYTDVDQTNTPINTVVTKAKDNTGRNLFIAVAAGYLVSKVVNN
jgi:hypothetical protein